MTDISLINRLFVFLVDIIAILLAIWVLLANRKSKINQIFFVMSLLLLLFITFAYLSDLSNQTQRALLWIKLAYGAVSLFFVAIYFFVMFFPRKEKSYPITDKIVLTIGLTLFFISVFTNFFIKDVEFKTGGTTPIFGKGEWAIFAVIFFLTLFILSQLLKKYFKLSEREKIQVQYFLIGLFLFAAMNVIFNVFLAPRYDVHIFYLLGNYSAIFLLGFTAFAIVRQELFGIKVILTQALVGIVAVLLLAQAVTATNWLDFSWKFALFLLFLFFGYLLIQSVIREIQRRAELQRLYEEVDKLSRAKSEFLSIASHQLRTPLTAIKGYISMILEGSYGKFEEKGRSPLERVYQSNERLIRLVNDLLNVSRIESGTLMTDFQKTSIEKMITSIIDELKIKADERKLYLKWQAPSAGSGHILPEIMADTDKLRQVIMNIIDNAIKYTEKGGITVRAELKDPSAKWPQGKILIEIKDTGEGMEKEEIDNMFGSFTRGRAGAKHWVSGLGLGLYIARKFTELHGGKIWVESEGEGKGSSFYVELPVK